MSSLTSHPQAGFNKEKLHSLVQVKLAKKKKIQNTYLPFFIFKKKRVRFLQSQGAKEDNNPEYAQIMNFLKNLQKQQVRMPDMSPVPAVPSQPSTGNTKRKTKQPIS